MTDPSHDPSHGPTQREKAATFRKLHEAPGLFLIPNPWDAGSARVLASLGYQALATTSSGLAYGLGVNDGDARITRQIALANAAAIAGAVNIPVSADLENLYSHEPAIAAATIPFAAASGIVGCSIEDASKDAADPIYPFNLAVSRVKAAVNVARSLDFPFTLTARAENYLHGRRDLADTIARLKAFEAVGADCLYAPGLSTYDEIREVLSAVTKPLNVLVSGFNADLDATQLQSLGVKRVSVGGCLNRAAYGALITGAKEMLHQGTFTYSKQAAPTKELVKLLTGDDE